MKTFNIAVSLFPENFLKKLVQLCPFGASISRLFLRKKVGLGDHTVRPFAKRNILVGGVGRSNKQEGESMCQQTPTFNFASSWSRTHDIAGEKLSPGGTGTTRRSGAACCTWGICPKTKFFWSLWSSESFLLPSPDYKSFNHGLESLLPSFWSYGHATWLTHCMSNILWWQKQRLRNKLKIQEKVKGRWGKMIFRVHMVLWMLHKAETDWTMPPM